MICYVTTLVRYEKYGLIYKLNLNSGEILNYNYIESNSNAAKHGGGHGLAMINNELVTATYSELVFLDLNLKKIRCISHPYLCGAHGLSVYNNRIWVSNCNNEAVLCFSPDGSLIESFFLYEDPDLMSLAGRPTEKIDRNNCYRDKTCPYESQPFHVNHVQETNENLYITLHKQGIIWDLYNRRIALKSQASKIHDGQFAYGRFYLNDTKNERIHVYDQEGYLIYSIPIDIMAELPAKLRNNIRNRNSSFLAQLIHRIPGIRKFGPPVYKCRTNWLRGLCILDCWTVIIGSSPGTVMQVDIFNKKITRTIPLTTDQCEAVFGIYVL